MSQYSQNVKSRLSFGESLTSVFNHYATFTGRARRSEYWWFFFAYGVVQSFFQLMQYALMYQAYESGYPLSFINNPAYTALSIMACIVFLGLLLPSLAVTVRRFHDIGKSGWNILWILLPIVGVILVLVWMCQDSDVVTNKYGISPKYNQI